MDSVHLKTLAMLCKTSWKLLGNGNFFFCISQTQNTIALLDSNIWVLRERECEDKCYGNLFLVFYNYKRRRKLVGNDLMVNADGAATHYPRDSIKVFIVAIRRAYTKRW